MSMDDKTNTLATQLVYLLQCGKVKMVIAICKILKMIRFPEAANSLIVRVDHELEFW